MKQIAVDRTGEPSGPATLPSWHLRTAWKQDCLHTHILRNFQGPSDYTIILTGIILVNEIGDLSGRGNQFLLEFYNTY